MTVSTGSPGPTGANGRRPAPAVCVADCVADSAGGITFDVAGAPGPGAALVLRRRDGPAPAGSDGVDHEVRLPLTGAGKSRLRAVLPSTVDLAEGYWDVWTGAGGDRPVRPGIRDVRALVDRVPGAGRVTARIPYPTGDGRLAVRSWVRSPHAEAGAIGREPGALTVEGVLYGGEPADGMTAEARLRGGDRVHRVPVTARAGSSLASSFAFTLPYAPLAAGPAARRQWWDLWLLPAPGDAAVRISRILDDIWDKQNIFVYPGQEVAGWLAAPCYAGDNGLCVRLDPAPVPAAAK